MTDVAQFKWPCVGVEIGPAGYISQTLTGDVFGKRGGSGPDQHQDLRPPS